MKPTVLIIDDDDAVRYALRAALTAAGLAAVGAANGAEGLATLTRGTTVDLVICDLRMPVMDGMGFLERMAELGHPVPVIMVTAHGSERDAVAAIKAGAVDYFPKPFDADELLAVVRRNLGAATERTAARTEAAGARLRQWMAFDSPVMLRLAERIERVARTDLPVLIHGETGSGKELVARAIVGLSPRRDAPYVSTLQDATAPSELFGHAADAFTGATSARDGLWGEANGGTLFLDEIGDLGEAVQPLLLRALETGEIRRVGEARSRRVDVRVLAATHRDLAAPGFRDDLRHRLDVVRLEIPPLRERPDDIAPIARALLARFTPDPPTLSPSTLQWLRSQRWPGNVRELNHTLQRMLVFSDDGELRPDLDVDAPADDLKSSVARYERSLIEAALARHDGNRSAAASELGIGRTTLVDKLKRLGLD